MRVHSYRLCSIVLLASVTFLQALDAEARAIRVDDDDGSGVWSLPIESSGDSLVVEDIGFLFDFFGTTTSTLTVNSNGSITFGDAIIAPFLDLTQDLLISYSTSLIEPFTGIPAAFRAQWGNDESANNFQLTLFDIGDGDFVMEFNYGSITEGSDATSSIGFDNGAGVQTDLIADLSTLLGDPLTFAEYSGTGADGLSADFCEEPALILACNNYYAATSQFGPGAALLPGIFDGYFQRDPSFGIDAQGRYLFLIDNEGEPPVDVPEPGTAWLLVAGLAAFALRRRRA